MSTPAAMLTRSGPFEIFEAESAAIGYFGLGSKTRKYWLGRNACSFTAA
jgi:hypothetical protein